MILTKELLTNILNGLREYLYNELYDRVAYGTFNEEVFNEAYDNAVFQTLIDETDNGSFEEE